MPRSGEDARRRLQQAAFELYLERGYDQTTATEIAARAGVTQRTFFRHFPDKREVLFDRAAVLSDALIGALAEAPAALTPFEALLRAFRSAEKFLEDNRPFTAPRQKVIANTPALQERELAKTAALIAALAEVLKRRGVEGRLRLWRPRWGWPPSAMRWTLGSMRDQMAWTPTSIAPSISCASCHGTISELIKTPTRRSEYGAYGLLPREDWNMLAVSLSEQAPQTLDAV